MSANDFRQKIKSLDELASIIKDLKKDGKIITHSHGVYDLLHIGHIRHLEAAKREGYILVVTVTKDEYVNKGPGRPVFNQTLRAESLAALQCVDYVAINEWPIAVETIKKLQPHVYVKGSDYAVAEDDLTGGIYQEMEAIKSIGGRIHFTDEITFSSTEILNNHFDVYPEEAQLFLKEFRQRYSGAEVIKQFEALKNLRVLVIGETIIDEYHYCQAMGKSPKETIVSTKYINEESFAGGVLATANHVAGFCQEVHLVTCLGTLDSKEEFILRHLKPNIKPRFFYRDDTCTIIKRRFVDPSFLTKMFEVSFLEDHPLPQDVEMKICNHLKNKIKDYDLILVADYGHGFITDNIRDLLCQEARFLAVNTQTNSANIGYNLITNYPRADYVCIDEPEMRLATHNKFGRLEHLIVNTAQKLNCNRFVVTRGHKGSLAYDAKNGFFETPVFSKEIVDRVGAGDAYLSVTSPCVAADIPMEVVGFIGNAAGALAVNIVCNRSSIESISLFKFITALLK